MRKNQADHCPEREVQLEDGRRQISFEVSDETYAQIKQVQKQLGLETESEAVVEVMRRMAADAKRRDGMN